MPSPVIEVEHLSVRRGNAAVLHDLTFAVERGRVTGLLGPSGSGKSTLMRVLVGVQAGVTGRAEVLGLPAGAAALRGRVGYVPQSPSVYADLSVAENLGYFAAVLGAPAAQVDAALEEVGLTDVRDRPVARLSGGQGARVSLAAALLGDPQLLVLDEPTVGLDPVLRRDLWAAFHRLAARGTTLVVSSHVMDEAARCDRLLLLRDGRLLADETPAGLRRRTGEADMDAAFLRLVDSLPAEGRPEPAVTR